MAVLPRHKVFSKKNQNLCLLFFLLTRSHNITKSQILNSFQIFYYFILFYGKLKRRSTGGGGGGVVAGENFLENLPVAPCATGKFSNFENFAANSKIF
jgi:hypothetical protein